MLFMLELDVKKDVEKIKVLKEFLLSEDIDLITDIDDKLLEEDLQVIIDNSFSHKFDDLSEELKKEVIDTLLDDISCEICIKDDRVSAIECFIEENIDRVISEME